MLGNNSLSGELPLWTGFPKAQLFGLSNNDLDGVLPDRWAFPELSQLQVCPVLIVYPQAACWEPG